MAHRLPYVLRHEYGTPRYLIAPNVESPVAYDHHDLADLPELPTVPGYFILSSDRDEWVPTDGLTYRTWAATIHVRSTATALSGQGAL